MSASHRLFTIRPATTNDLPRICEFAAEFLHKMSVGVSVQEALQVFQYVLKHPNAGIIIVAEHKDGVCAYAYASYEWRSEFGGETMHCVELFVEQAWRKKGVGANLVGELVQIARQRGIRRVAAEVHAGNATMERILETSGFDPEHRTIWGMHV